MAKQDSEYVDCCLCGADDTTFLFHDYQDDKYVRCNNCHLVYQNPRQVTQYEENFWEATIDPDGTVRHLLEEREDKIKNRYAGDISYIHKLPPGKILDVGCGPGFFLSAIDSKWEKYGTDISEFTIDYVRQHFPDINAFAGELSQAKYDDNFFNVVYCFAVMEHIGNHHEVLKEIHRITKPGGTLITSTPNIESFCARRFKGNYRLLSTPHIVLWSKATLTSLLEKNGFELFKVRYPFFGTKYFTLNNLFRLLNTKSVSPPCYGNEMTIYARKV
ncbi:class I SAM-dependent methyltransferase [Chloroflexota bacterium]